MSQLVLDQAFKLVALNAGRVEPLGPDGVLSAISKNPVAGCVRVTRLGLAGDEQADRRHHGGSEKALHHYPAQHYIAWRVQLPSRSAQFEVGGFGENIATDELDEANVCLGDVFRMGQSVVQVSQARSPCAKLNLRFNVPDMVQRVVESGRTGWYYRVLDEGDVCPDSELIRLERPCPHWPLTRLWQVLFGQTLDRAALVELAGLDVLSGNWRERATRRLENSSTL